MSSPKWTKEQQEVIESRNCDLLVAAAAGSGKTAVLVERIIKMITSKEEKIDIDKLLVVTFTNAAASEMRERIGDAIVKELEANPEDKFLKNQILLLNKAKITTIHSFCLDVIKSNFHTIDLDPNFRIGDQNECNLIKKEAIEEVFDEMYEDRNLGLLNLVESYAEKGGDRAIEEMIMQIHNFARTSPDPEKWLTESAERFNVDDSFEFSNSIWAKYILEYVKIELEGLVASMKSAIDLVHGTYELETFEQKLIAEYEGVYEIYKLCCEGKDLNDESKFTTSSPTTDVEREYGESDDEKTVWSEVYSRFRNFEFENYRKGVKNVSKDAVDAKLLKEKAKAIRDKAKKSIEDIIKSSFNKDEEMIKNEMKIIYNLVRPISDVVIKFDERYSDKKREKSIIDFGDIEHFALRILTRRDEDGNLVSSEIAKKYQEVFYEIFIDEYQDSNLVQEVLLKSVARTDRPNRFMVGDVKQSIYRFRQARPELFLQKYNDYSGEKGDSHRKIMLYKNFRSRDEVIDSINYVFENAMSEKIGEISYTEDERLNLGAIYKENEDEKSVVGGVTEIHLIEKNSSKSDSQSGAEKGEDSEKVFGSARASSSSNEIADGELQDGEEPEELDNIQIEARMVGKIIKNLMSPDEDGRTQMVFDKHTGEYRAVEYKDIVILLRATSSWAPVFSEELTNMDIPVYSDTGVGYFETTEIKVVMSILQVIDNPMQDIPLLAALRSPVFGFTPDDMANVRMIDRESSIYECLERISRVDLCEVSEGELEISKENSGVLDIDQEIPKIEAQLIEDASKILEGEFVDEFKKTSEKAKFFMKKLKLYREKSVYMSTHEFLWYIYNDSGYYAYAGAMPGGLARQANLRVLFERAKQFGESSYKGLFNFIEFVDKLKKSSDDMGSAKTLGESADVVRIMSIHKSKGLEFPVVICSAMGKNFNMMDFKKKILYHHDLGYGPQVVDFDRRISFPSIAKDALKKKMMLESLSEEMRVLYVALTRAKEKLILTGSTRSVEKSMNKWAENIGESGKISEYGVLKGRNYLDWIMPSVIKHRDSENLRDYLDLEVFTDADRSRWKTKIWDRNEISINSLENKEVSSLEAIIRNLDIDEYSSDYRELIEKNLDFKYKYALSTKRPSSISVTEIKKIQQEYENDESTQMFDFSKTQDRLKKPMFIQESGGVSKISPSERGTITHLVMQLLDLTRVENVARIKDQVLEFIEKKIITETQAEVINPFKLYKFFSSDLGRRMLLSDTINREKVIYSKMSLKDVYSEDEEIENDEEGRYSEEQMMLRGIIDAYFEEDDKIVIVDYKTDYVDDENIGEVVGRYEKQLSIYAKSLADLTGKEVKEKWLYLFGKDMGVKY
ncbi:MAG: UvrD-helicase domain-containing protein [Clostridioides sp.]|jgi:ATP-dependent helicase/nuclease subunit A|nr:UvrD-helicase domain-containing protein [Clostridioides sp.]